MKKTSYYNVRLLPDAYLDITEARNWYRKHTPDLPKKINKQLHSTIARIFDNPVAYSIKYKSVRIANLKNFPYSVHFIVEEKEIIIIAIHHTSMSPERWRRRI